MSDPPFISIIIPAYNEEAYLPAALASVAAQRYPSDRIECIVVDNASTDGTTAVIQDFAETHPALSVFLEHEPIPGVGRAKNRGAKAAQGDVLIFLDADSRVDPTMAADVATCWEVGGPAGSIKIIADSSHPIDRGFFALMEVGKVLFGIRSQMMYCDRELFFAVGGFDPHLRLAEDLDFLKRVRRRVHETGQGTVCHVRSSAIHTSPRRLRALPYHLGIFPMFGRWLLAFMGIGRDREY